MCYRYTLTDLAAFRAMIDASTLGVDFDLTNLKPRYNVALTSLMPVITRRGKPRLETLRFGLSLPARAGQKTPPPRQRSRRDPARQARVSRRRPAPPLPCAG